MHSAFITINKVPTKISTWGKWIEEDFDENERDLVIFIPGNPGVPSFYQIFLETLHNQLGWPVWVIGHAGHERPENELLHVIPSLDSNKELFDLEGQVKHKVEFFDKYVVPKNVRIHLIGHSAGAYIITKLLKIEEINKMHAKSYLLFPTLEFIGDTPNGVFYNLVLKRVVFIILFFSWIFSILPYQVRYFLVYIYTMVTGATKEHIKTICHFVHSQVLERVFFMATDEMIMMKERENDVIKNNLKDIRCYFGSADGWAPVSYCDKLKADFPDIQTEICQRKFDRGFVLKSSKEVGMMVAGWIKEN